MTEPAKSHWLDGPAALRHDHGGIWLLFLLSAAATVCTDRLLWYLGAAYWVLLTLLGIASVYLAWRLITRRPRKAGTVFAVTVVLAISQWWLIELVLMQLMWIVGGFAP